MKIALVGTLVLFVATALLSTLGFRTTTAPTDSPANSSAVSNTASENDDDDVEVRKPAIQPLDTQSIYARALKSPTGMLPTSESIEMFQSRVELNRHDYGSWMVLGRLYMRRAEENDDFRDLTRSEQSFDEALNLMPDHIGALTFKAMVQNQQHKFAQSYVTAKKALDLKAGNFTALAEMGDAQMQLGNLKEAASLFDELHKIAETPGSYARLARLAELRGKNAESKKLLETAIEHAEKLSQEPAEVAWYHWRLAELAWNAGQMESCQKQCSIALEATPDDAAAATTQAKLWLANNEATKAIHLLQEVIKESPEPPILSLLGDMYHVDNQPELANEFWQRAKSAMAQEATFAGNAHLRERAMFLLDHNLEIESALEMAKADLQNRSDLYAHDALAWALLKNQQVEEAKQEIEVALAVGSRDPLLQFHAMEIYFAAGELDKAKLAARQLNGTNPQFQPIHSSVAKSRIQKLLN